LESNQKPYINVGFCLDYGKAVFFPYFVSLRDPAEFAAEVVILVMEHYSVHVSHDVVHLVNEARV
jgi:hypothetical protein